MQSNQPSRKYSRWRKWRESIQIWGLVIPGLAGILISIVSFFYSPKDLAVNFLLFLFSILALAIGLERYEAFGEERQEAQLRHEIVIDAINQFQRLVENNDQNLSKEVAGILQTMIASNVIIKPLSGSKEMYAECVRILKASKGSEIIRSAAFVRYPTRYDKPGDLPVSAEYFETLAKTIGQAKQKKQSMVYKVVMGFDLNERGEPPSDGQRSILKRRELFQQYHALDRMEIRCLGSYWPLNLLMIGQELMFIGFPTIAKNDDMRTGILINHTEFVTGVVRWYDECLWSEAKAVSWTGEETQQ